MKTLKIAAALGVSFCLLTGCNSASIDAKKKQVSTSSSRSASVVHLTDKDVFGNESTLNVSEEDIQNALEGERFSVPLHSSIVLVQSGSQAPDVAMQQEMSKYYNISTFAGISDKKKTPVCNKDSPDVENMNYMQALRYIAAKGKQKAILVYWGRLEAGKYDPVIKEVLWSEYKNEKTAGTGIVLRYLLRFALVDVATGEWVTYSPTNYEYSEPLPSTGTGDITEQQIMQLRKKTYERAVADFVNRYK
ncbi:hypothetical protein DPK65_13740 [Salmonella enterica subsp. enterica]|uniref:Aminopeptidase n=1 Tax=Salmonella enterica subsp. enterica serovar Kintambo TaxID=1192730 RepID=A0A5W7RZB7_SALET|nr:hypothetical protein [Salmonella enterica subsp. enterica serovar Kintambo]ECE6153263.1 hypothetical protein [Salmonella enterica subsp. enterica]ECJ4522083.1 hypothetical protein [Salmonella enterica subsp. enterica]HAK2952917.1 hypothetical protein [Salmonella enterica]